MGSETAVTYSTVRRGLRSARVVIVFDGGQNWSYWARRALYLASRTWGGRGFVLVPHQDGHVAPALLRACRTYDPDHVVTFRQELVDFEYFLPDHFQMTGEDGLPLAGRDRWEALAGDNIWWDTHTDSDRQARDQIAAVCSPYKGAGDGGDIVRHFGQQPEDFPDVNLMPGLAVVNCAQCPPNWGGLLGVAVASHAGLVDAPNPAAVEPEVDDATRRRLTRWMMGTGSLPPESLARLPLDGANLSDIGRAWDYTTSGLIGVSRFGDSSPEILVVVGDSAEDFALARLWQHTYGQGIWLPSVLGADEDGLPAASVMQSVVTTYSTIRSTGATVTVTSTSLPGDDLARVLERLRAEAGTWFGDEADGVGKVLPAGELVWPRRATVHLGIGEQFDEPLSVPTEVDPTGTRTMLTPLPSPLLHDRVLARHLHITWHVDITWPDDRSVLGGGMTGRELLAPSNGLAVTLARSGRYGTSYPSRRHDLVLPGIPAADTLAQPRLRDLSLAAWVDAKLAQHDLTSRLSSAGHKTAQLARMFGDRHAVMDLLAGPLLPALRKMDARGKRSKDCYPQDEGVRIRAGYGVLNFAGFATWSTASSKEQVRRDLDTALRAGVIRRGLVLECQVCTELQFQPIDRLGQRWTCERCDAGNDLDQPAWNLPLQEPCWFYDLHPVGRQLLADHGEVPIALAAHLARTSNSHSAYQDLAEIEFVGNGRAQVELDLIAYRDGILSIGEAKSAAQLNGKNTNERAKEIRKKCQAAVWLEADELIFATSAANWTPGTETSIREVAAAFGWPPIGPPVIRMLAGLDIPGMVTAKVLSLQ
ncbi:hypothetical protein [Nocardia sp. alder85J]|uniref:hypothetical protein n=1 Tax=Nocardia sp. alder85J TaxID=2862949 RepID=UPI001CD4B213|nr:hypothetical protein [Nocardia sp. alder85J]MCX4093613.1 hypothetical protein [Nocardia sp. alder85J]